MRIMIMWGRDGDHATVSDDLFTSPSLLHAGAYSRVHCLISLRDNGWPPCARVNGPTDGLCTVDWP